MVEVSRIEDRLELLENQLMSKVLNEWNEQRTFVPLLRREYFRNENYLLYSMLSKIYSENVELDGDFVEIYLQSHQNEFAHDKDRIEFEVFAEEGISELHSVLIATKERFLEYMRKEFYVEESFTSLLGKFKEVFSGLELQDTLQEAGNVLVNGAYYGRRNYKGVEGTIEYMERRLSNIKSSLGGDESYTIRGSRTSYKSIGDGKKPIHLCNLPEVPTLDKAMKGVKTNTLVTMVAPEKGMKSKMAVMVTHRVLMNGHNALFWGKEGGDIKVYAELRATHFDYYYNKLRSRNYPPISGQDILEDNFPDEKYKQLEQISWQDLFENPKYGELYTPDYPFMAENIEMVIKEGVSVGKCKFFVIDYVQIMDSEVYKDKLTLISKSYGLLETLKGRYNICIWCPAQLATNAVQDLSKGNKRELRNLTAESTEPTKSADVNFLLYTNREMELQGLATVIVLPSRTFSSTVDDIPVYTDRTANCIYEIKLREEVEDYEE